MKRKIAVGSVLLATGIGLSFTTPTFAQTAKSYAYHGTKIVLNGKRVSAPSHISAVDPFGGANAKETSFVPIWYIDTALHSAGITPKWNGHILSLTVPSNISINYPTTPKAISLSSTVMAIQINGKAVTYAPKIAYPDAGSKTLTTFVPVFYLEKALGYIGIQTGWDGTTWSMTMPATSAPAKNKTIAQTSSNNTGGTMSSNSSQTAPNQGAAYPDRWTAPVLTTAWNPSMVDHFDAGELQLFQSQLGFSDGGHQFGIPGAPDAIQISSSTNGQAEVSISWRGWGPDNYNPKWDPNFPQAYRIPVISMQLFKFYFGGDAQRVWDYFNTNHIPPKFVANGRQVTALSGSDGSVTLVIGYKKS